MTPLQKHAIPVLIIFHVIGLIGMIFINTDTFADLTFYNLLLSLFLILLCHEAPSNSSLIALLISVFILGFGVEVLGIKTGFPFGDYTYGYSLGPRLFKVPLVIGVNWFLMVMGSGFLAMKLVKNSILRVILASIIMVGVDMLIENIAPKLNYWYWDKEIVPLANYIAWFAVSVIMQILFLTFVKQHSNKLAIPYIFTVAVFFGFLNLFL